VADSEQLVSTQLLATPVVIVAGKGGVGKTTVTAVLARVAATLGRRVLVVELDGKPTLAELVPDLPVRHISAADSLEEYLQDHGFRRIAKRLAATGVIDVVSTASPGIDDLVVLGKIKQLERSGEWDSIIVDGPAAGHAITFLTSAAGLRDAVRSGPVRSQADDVLELLSDAERCQVVLVAIPEATPVNELIETTAAIRDRVGARLGPVVLNQCDLGPTPPAGAVSWAARTPAVERQAAAAAAAFRRERLAAQAVEHERLRAHVDQPLVVLALSATVDEMAQSILQEPGS
jgi:arsenite/tail-anchored protein-transporting ATPase